MTRRDPSNTDRLWVFYFDGVYNHSLQFRFLSSTTSDGAVMTVAHDYLTALDTDLYAITVVKVEKANSGSNIRNPVTWTGSPDYGATTMPDVNAPRYMEFTGRDHVGARWHLEQFSINFATPSTYEIALLDRPNVGDAWAVLDTAFSTGVIVSIAGERVILHSVVPVGFNDHYIVGNRG